MDEENVCASRPEVIDESFSLIHSEEKFYSCDRCAYTTNRKDSLQKHQVVHTTIRLPCEQCQKSFKRKKGLKRHQIVHTNQKQETCGQCSKSFISNPNLKAHQKLVHTTIRLHKCEQCRWSFKRNTDLKRHILGHQEKHCDHCAFTTKDVRAFNKHIKVNHDGIKFQCNMCDNEYLVKGDLKRHEKAKHEIVLKCSLCKYSSWSEEKLRNHRKTKHESKLIKCGLCCYKSWSFENVNGHKKREHSILIKCDSCEFSNVYKEKVKRHFSRNHGEKQKCTICQSEHTALGLKVHMNQIHADKNVPCKYCDFVTNSSQRLRWHVDRFHTVHNCDKCDHTSSTSITLKIHQKNKHEGVRYKCPQ